jgi:undecaprenyl diphosphate synthase
VDHAAVFPPDVDLVIRTGGELRLSDFMLWECAYAELWFSPVLWPDFTQDHLETALGDFRARTRRFGAVSAVAPDPMPLGTLSSQREHRHGRRSS